MKKNRLAVFFTFLGFSLFLIPGCTSKSSQAPVSSNAPAPGAPQAPMPTPQPMKISPDSAAITGKVSFQGAAPAMRAVSMEKEKTCATAHANKPQREETVAVNPNKTLQYVVVYVKSGLPTNATFSPPPPVTLDQKTCWYTPHVTAVMTGQTINVINSDPGVLHNIHFMPRMNTPLNFGQPGPAPGASPPSRAAVFQKPEFIPVKCDVHSWMHAYVGVISNPFFAVTDSKGEYAIKGLPPGQYTLEAWQEKYGTQDLPVVVKAKEKKTLNFTFR